MEPLIATILLLGLAIGVIFKTYLPYRSKEKAGTIVGFDKTYLWTAIAAFMGALMSALAMFQEASMAWAEGWPFGTGYGAVFAFGFFWAMGWNYGVNQALKPKSPSEQEIKEARII